MRDNRLVGCGCPWTRLGGSFLYCEGSVNARQSFCSITRVHHQGPLWASKRWSSANPARPIRALELRPLHRASDHSSFCILPHSQRSSQPSAATQFPFSSERVRGCVVETVYHGLAVLHLVARCSVTRPQLGRAGRSASNKESHMPCEFCSNSRVLPLFYVGCPAR